MPPSNEVYSVPSLIESFHFHGLQMFINFFSHISELTVNAVVLISFSANVVSVCKETNEFCIDFASCYLDVNFLVGVFWISNMEACLLQVCKLAPWFPIFIPFMLSLVL